MGAITTFAYSIKNNHNTRTVSAKSPPSTHSVCIECMFGQTENTKPAAHLLSRTQTLHHAIVSSAHSLTHSKRIYLVRNREWNSSKQTVAHYYLYTVESSKKSQTHRQSILGTVSIPHGMLYTDVLFAKHRLRDNPSIFCLD